LRLAVPPRQCVACDVDELFRCRVEQDRLRRRQIAQRRDAMTAHDLAVERSELRGERLGDRL
jgi:hypothetical protein